MPPGESENVNAAAMKEANKISFETTHPCNGNEDEEVDITGFTNYGRESVVKDTCGDETDYSSSFGVTGSGDENDSFSDPEVESRMSDPWHQSYQRRKKSMTAHWRKFIRPIEWRCKWIELRLKQLHSQAQKYSKELAAYDHTKEVDMAHLTLDGSAVKSVPLSGRKPKNKVMKRYKRKKVEEKCDLASYMSNHSLFSYYNEKADCYVDSHLKDCPEVALDGDNGNMVEFKLNELWTSDKNDYTDNSLVNLIQKLEAMQAQLQNLKTRCDKMISDNRLSVPEPCNGLNHSDSNPASSSHEAIISLVEDSYRPEHNDLSEDIMDVDLMPNQVAKEELHDLENVGNQLVKKTQESIEENRAISLVQVPAPDSAENAVHKMHSTFRRCSILNQIIPRNRRTATRKSGGPNRWDWRNTSLARARFDRLLNNQDGSRN